MTDFNRIINPVTNTSHSIFSSDGRELLKNYLITYKTGGSGVTFVISNATSKNGIYQFGRIKGKEFIDVKKDKWKSVYQKDNEEKQMKDSDTVTTSTKAATVGSFYILNDSGSPNGVAVNKETQLFRRYFEDLFEEIFNEIFEFVKSKYKNSTPFSAANPNMVLKHIFETVKNCNIEGQTIKTIGRIIENGTMLSAGFEYYPIPYVTVGRVFNKKKVFDKDVIKKIILQFGINVEILDANDVIDNLDKEKQKKLYCALIACPWTSEEDKILSDFIEASASLEDPSKWSEVAKNLPGRTGEQCRERSKHIKKGP